MSKTPRPPYSRLSPAQRGAITRRARAEGKDPARVHAAYKGAETRARNRYREAVRHGKRARKATEKRLTTKQRRERAQRGRRVREKARVVLPPVAAPPLTLKALSRIRPRDDDYEVEFDGHQDSYTGEWE